MLSIKENQLVFLAKKYLNTNLKRYIVVGGSAYVSEMSVIFFCKNVIGMTNVEAVALSYWFGLAIGFLLQKVITFGNLDRRFHILGKQMIMYGILVGFNYALNLLAVNIFAHSSNVYLVRTLVILFCTFINFPVYKIIFSNNNIK
ncbi:MAG: GtrA family protein [bacterium]|jgi:putative flippase GtrA